MANLFFVSVKAKDGGERRFFRVKSNSGTVDDNLSSGEFDLRVESREIAPSDIATDDLFFVTEDNSRLVRDGEIFVAVGSMAFAAGTRTLAYIPAYPRGLKLDDLRRLCGAGEKTSETV